MDARVKTYDDKMHLISFYQITRRYVRDVPIRMYLTS